MDLFLSIVSFSLSIISLIFALVVYVINHRY